MDWTEIVWKIAIALAPIVVGIFAKLVQDFILTRSEAQQATIRSWVETFIKAAQMMEPDPEKRKLWVVGKITTMFPLFPKENVSALIEAVLAELKLEYEETDWADLPPAA